MARGSIRTEVDRAPGFRIWREQPLEYMPFHWHDQVEINYSVGGSLTYLLAGSVVRVMPGKLSVFWAGMPHSVVGRTPVEDFYWVYVPLVWLLRLGLPGNFMRRVMGGEMIVDANPLEEDRVVLDRWSREAEYAGESRGRLVVREVENRLTRLALDQPDKADTGHVSPGDGPVKKISRMARYVAEHHSRPLSLEDVACHVGLHPNYATKLFHQYYGMTLSAYLTRLRVCEAQYLLISTDWETSRVAFEAGFGSVSRFYEAFKKISGQTPRNYRLASSLH